MLHCCYTLRRPSSLVVLSGRFDNYNTNIIAMYRHLKAAVALEKLVGTYPGMINCHAPSITKDFSVIRVKTKSWPHKWIHRNFICMVRFGSPRHSSPRCAPCCTNTGPQGCSEKLLFLTYSAAHTSIGPRQFQVASCHHFEKSTASACSLTMCKCMRGRHGSQDPLSCKSYIHLSHQRIPMERAHNVGSK